MSAGRQRGWGRGTSPLCCAHTTPGKPLRVFGTACQRQQDSASCRSIPQPCPGAQMPQRRRNPKTQLCRTQLRKVRTPRPDTQALLPSFIPTAAPRTGAGRGEAATVAWHAAGSAPLAPGAGSQGAAAGSERPKAPGSDVLCSQEGSLRVFRQAWDLARVCLGFPKARGS